MGVYITIEEARAMTDEEIEKFLTKRDRRDISKSLLDDKEKYENGTLFSNTSEKLDSETERLLFLALENMYKHAKVINKARFTPKKYRKG